MSCESPVPNNITLTSFVQKNIGLQVQQPIKSETLPETILARLENNVLYREDIS